MPNISTSPRPVLDKGFVRYVDHMGNDQSIVDAARVSYQQGTTQKRNTAGLIDYLIRNEHMSPTEMVEFKFHIKAPIFVARQWVRHRMVSWNEVSARYSEMTPDFYIPDYWRAQDQKNKQKSIMPLTASKSVEMSEVLKSHCLQSFHLYTHLLEQGVGRELARMVLPVNLYTEWYWKCNARTLSHFLNLRDDSHAQSEIQAYAAPIRDIFREVAPLTYEAFDKHLWSK